MRGGSESELKLEKKYKKRAGSEDAKERRKRVGSMVRE